MADDRRARSASEVTAERVRAHREQKGWSQERLARAMTELGHPMHQTAIAKIEARLRKVTVDDLLVLAVALEVPPPLLFLPIDTEEDLALTPSKKVYPWRVWEWLHGEEPLPACDTPGWHAGSEAALLYANVRDAQKAANQARHDVPIAEYEGDAEAVRLAKKRHVTALRALHVALQEMEARGFPTARLIGGFEEDLVRLGIRNKEEQA